MSWKGFDLQAVWIEWHHLRRSKGWEAGFQGDVPGEWREERCRHRLNPTLVLDPSKPKTYFELFVEKNHRISLHRSLPRLTFFNTN